MVHERDDDVAQIAFVGIDQLPFSFLLLYMKVKVKEVIRCKRSDDDG